jgi:peptidyl-prolyl cis-trans isomerase C
MRQKITFTKMLLLGFVFVQIMGVSGCNPSVSDGNDPISGTHTAEAILPTATVTPTPIPLAFTIDGLGYLLQDFQIEFQRYQIVKENSEQTEVVENPEEYVLDQLIDKQLLLRAATQNGCVANEADVQSDWEKLLSNLPEGESIDTWLNKRGYNSEDEFKIAMRNSLLEACQIKIIAESVPDDVEQIHARQILLSDYNLAGAVINQLEVGVEFATLAYQYDAVTGGDLGWFPQGYLLQPLVDEAVFTLQPGQHTDIIETELGYHIVYVYAREIHPLSLDARKKLQIKAVEDWLNTERDNAEISILIP